MASRATHYALTYGKAGPLEVLQQQNDNDKKVTRSQLAQVYQSYAELYPNPHLVEEFLQRDRLLAEIRQELEEDRRLAEEANPELAAKRQSETRGGGFLGFLFGRSKKVLPDVQFQDDHINEEDYLIYTNANAADELDSNNLLCGTQSALDGGCIPTEAHSVARFHLSSPSLPVHVNRAHEEAPILLILGLGVVAELVDDSWKIVETSDKQDLEDYVAAQQQQDGHNSYHLKHCRSTLIGPNCLAISWGLQDGLTILYRRVEGFRPAELGWDAVALAAPTRAVLDNLQAVSDVFLQNNDGSLSSQLLRVTEVAPLLVETDGGVVAGTLVVSRLGGYMELLPLPAQLWHGPILTPKNHKRQAPPRKKKRGQQQQQHYAMGHLFNIASEEQGIAALTVGDHLDDLLHVQVFRTPVSVDTEWDNETFPDSPPAEYLLVANGSKNGEERITFWAVATIFSENPNEGFAIHVGFLEEYSMGSIGEVSIFADNGIMEYWRKPRRVQRRSKEMSEESSDELVSPNTVPVGTLSAQAPVVSMRFKVISNNLALSVLDWNGGVSIFNCTAVLKSASQTLTKEELESFEDSPMTVSLLSRDKTRKRVNGGTVIDMEWSMRGELAVVTSNNKLFLLVVDLQSGCAASPCLALPSGTSDAKLVGGDNLSLLLPSKAGSILQIAELQSSSPTSMIERLINASKFSEALEAAEAFPDQDSVREIVATCHKHLWEENRLVDSLIAIPDDAYVIEQVVALFRGESETKGLDMTSCYTACRLALKRCTTVRVASALQLSEELEIMKAKLADWSVRAGTYTLLCQHLVANGNTKVFFDKFVNGSLAPLASQMASRGDMKALTIVLVRHRKELSSDRMNILDEVPLSVEPSSYSHLLPVFQVEQDYVDSFLTVDEIKGIRPSSALLMVAEQELGYPVLLADEDSTTFPPDSSDDESDERVGREEIASWFVERGRRMQKIVGTLPLLLVACDLAIRCIGSSSPSLAGNAHAETLIAFKAFAQHFDEILCSADLSSSSEVELLQASIEDLAQMPIPKLVSMLLGMPRSELQATTRFNKHVLPVLSMPGISTEDKSDGGVLNDKLDDALSSFCTNLMKRKLSESESEAKKVRDLRETMGTCVAVCMASRSSISKQNRMIRNRECMMRIVVSLCQEVSRSCSKLRLLPTDARDLIKKMWQLYECLPSALAPNEKSNEELVQLNDQVDALFLSLVAVDILANWSPSKALDILSKQELNGPLIASEICEGFCKDTANSHQSMETKVKLVHDLSSDLLQLRSDAFHTSFDLEPVIHQVLLMGLLQQGEFELFVEVFSTELGSLANWERMQPTVLGFVNEAMFGDANDTTSRFSFETDKVHTAIQCQDILGSRFPQLQAAFTGMRRHLDAAHFINSVLCPDNENLSPSDIRDKLPFDVVEHVLNQNPMCILHGCDEWASADFGRDSNRGLWSYFHFRGDPNAHISMPSVPGSAVVHLASIVGLESPGAHLVVQNRMVHYAKLASLPWVGAAIALTMVSEKGEQSEENTLRLDTAEMVVCDESYDDTIVKTLLCRGALSLSPFQNSLSVFSVLQVFSDLEHKVSRFCPASWEQGQRGHSESQKETGSEFLVFRAAGLLANTAKTMVNENQVAPKPKTLFDRDLVARPVDRVFQDTLGGYSADLNALFQILQSKASTGEEDDALLVAIGRFFVFWCISNSISIIEHENQGNFEQADAYANLELSASLLLHSKDSKAVLSNISEMKEIAEMQSVGAIEQVAAHPRLDPVRPDLAIVRKLIELGYSENGARRAAAATKNESQQAAMLWAVAHSMEPSFNAPLIFVKPTQNPVVDQYAVRNVKKFLHTIDSHFKGSMPLISTTSTSAQEDVDFAVLAHTLSPPQKKRVPERHAAQAAPPLPLPPLTVATTEKAAELTQQSAQIGQARSISPNVQARQSSAPVAVEAKSKERSENLSIANVPLVQSRQLPTPTAVGNEAEVEKPSELKVPQIQPRQVPVSTQTGVSTKPANGSPPKLEVPMMQSRQLPAPIEPGSKIQDKKSSKLKVPQMLPRQLSVSEETDVSPKPVNEEPPKQARQLTPSMKSGETPKPLDETPSKLKVPPPPPRTAPLPLIIGMDLAANAQRAPTPPPVPQVEESKRAPPSSAPRHQVVPPPPPQPTSMVQSGTPGRRIVTASPKSAPANLDRSTLRRAGEFVRDQSRGVSNRLDHEERKRLLRKGRQLFERTRSSPKKLISPRTASTTTASPFRSARLIDAMRSPPPPPRPPPPPPKPAPVVKEAPIIEESDLEEDLATDDGWDFEDF